MQIGVRRAKAELSKLIESALNGETIVITNHGKPLVRLVPESSKPKPRRGFGCLREILELKPGWDSRELDDEIEDMFDHIQELKQNGLHTGRSRHK